MLELATNSSSVISALWIGPLQNDEENDVLLYNAMYMGYFVLFVHHFMKKRSCFIIIMFKFNILAFSTLFMSLSQKVTIDLHFPYHITRQQHVPILVSWRNVTHKIIQGHSWGYLPLCMMCQIRIFSSSLIQVLIRDVIIFIMKQPIISVEYCMIIIFLTCSVFCQDQDWPSELCYMYLECCVGSNYSV